MGRALIDILLLSANSQPWGEKVMNSCTDVFTDYVPFEPVRGLIIDCGNDRYATRANEIRAVL